MAVAIPIMIRWSIPPEGWGKQADLVVVVQGSFVGPADVGKISRPQAGGVLFLPHEKIPP